MIDWRSDTYDIEADGWLRAVVGLFNSQHGTVEEEQRSWRFTAVSAGRQQALWLAKRVSPAPPARCLSGARPEAAKMSWQTTFMRTAHAQVGPLRGGKLRRHSNQLGRASYLATSKDPLPAPSTPGRVCSNRRTAEHSLDEIGEHPLDLQVKLLRVIETRRVTAVAVRATGRWMCESLPQPIARWRRWLRKNVPEKICCFASA